MIHPFQDGNGRLSRALTTLLLLLKSNYTCIPYSSLERVIEENKEKYYLNLREAQTEGHDKSVQLVKWVEFFLDCLRKQKDTLLKKLEKEKALFSLPILSEQIMLSLKEHGKLSLSEVVKLVEIKQIQKEGIGKGTVTIFNSRQSERWLYFIANSFKLLA